MNNSIKISIIVLFMWSLFVINDLKIQKIHNIHKQEIQKYKDELSGYKNFVLTITAYTVDKNECDPTPDKTAINTKPIPGYTVAVSRDLSYMLGREIWIEGLGVWHVNDVMNKRHESRIDIVVKNKEVAKAWGKRERRVVLL